MIFYADIKGEKYDGRKRYCEKVLSLALDLGKNMVKCGAEVNRAEQAVMRICYAYGMEKAQVFRLSL